jgi:hypothetical protein
MADEYVARLSAKSVWCHTCFAGLANIPSKFKVLSRAIVFALHRRDGTL